VFQFVGGINLAAALPQPLDAVTGLQLQTLSFQYDFSKPMLEKFTIAMNAPAYTWDIFNNGQLVLGGFAFTFVNDRTAKAPAPAVTFSAASSFLINGKGPIDVTLSYATPVFTLSGAPDAKATPVTLVDFVDAFLSADGPLLPESLSPVTVQSVKATFSRASGKTPAAYTLSVLLDGNASWALSNTLSVESVGFKVDATKAPVTGSITGRIEFFKSQPKPLALDVSAVYTGTEWVLDTTQVADTDTDVASILGGLGFSVPSPLNFTVSDFGSTIHTGSTSPSPYAVVSGSVAGFTMPFDSAGANSTRSRAASAFRSARPAARRSLQRVSRQRCHCRSPQSPPTRRGGASRSPSVTSTPERRPIRSPGWSRPATC